MSFPRYARYERTGNDLLSEIPEYWTFAIFSRVVARIKDGTHGTFARTQEGKPLLSAKNIGAGTIDIADDESLISKDDHAEIVANGFPASGDLLLTIVGSIGRAAVYTHEEPLAFQRSVCFVRLASGHDPRFYYYFTQSKFFQEQLQSRSKSAAQSGVYMGDLVAIPVVYPEMLEEQRAIAAFLDRETAKIDSLVEEQKRLIELLKEKRQAVISQAVTKGLDPSVPLKDSGVAWLGEVPAHWEVKPIKSVVQLRSGGTPDRSRADYWDGDVPWASAKDLKVDSLSDTEDHITRTALMEGAAALIQAGTVLVVVRGMILARTFPVVTAQVEMAINQDLKAVSARPPQRNDWLAWLLRASTIETLSRLDEAGHGTKALRMDAWGEMRIPVPPPHEQARAAVFLVDACLRLDNLVTEAERAITILTERRSALISAAVTGKIDVRGQAPH